MTTPASPEVNTAMVRYEAMCWAITECRSVDEIKDIRDKALALELYAQQARNTDAERQAYEIRIRAEHRAGELLKEMKESGERHTGRNDSRVESTGAIPQLKDLGISPDQSSKWQQLAEIPKEHFETLVKDPEIKGTVAILKATNPLMSSESDEWNTPPEIVDLVVDVLGKIDLDPCCNDGDQNVPAKHVLRRVDDGLTHTWHGKIYMNPPYGRAVGDWAAKLVEQFTSGIATEAIALVAARVDTEWFQHFAPYTVCFIRGRLKFGDADNSATFPSAAIYLGKNKKRFVQVFSSMGWFPNLNE